MLLLMLTAVIMSVIAAAASSLDIKGGTLQGMSRRANVCASPGACDTAPNGKQDPPATRIGWQAPEGLPETAVLDAFSMSTIPATGCGPAQRRGTLNSLSGINVTMTENYAGVEGLTQSIVFFEQQTYTDFSIPDWLLQAYGGKPDAVIREIEIGRLHDRRANDDGACQRTVAAGTEGGTGSVDGGALLCGGAPRVDHTVDASSGINVSMTENFAGVEGLVRSTVTFEGEVYTDYSIPSWLFDAYGGNIPAIIHEIENGRLTNRRAGNCGE
jgi:hypothetical protein